MDKYEYNLIGEIDEILQDKIVFLEYKKPQFDRPYAHVLDDKSRKLIFKVDKSNFVFNFKKNDFISKGSLSNTEFDFYLSKVGLSCLSYYEDFSKFDNIFTCKKLEYESNSMSLFALGGYFKLRYGLDFASLEDFNQNNQSIDFIELLVSLYDQEIEYYRRNIHLVFDKNDIIKKFGALFTKAEQASNTKYLKIQCKQLKQKEDLSQSNTHKPKEPKGGNEQKEQPSKSSQGMVQKEDLPKMSQSSQCSYCNKAIEQDDELLVCESCQEVDYCSENCKVKDLRFHKRKCKVKTDI